MGKSIMLNILCVILLLNLFLVGCRLPVNDGEEQDLQGKEEPIPGIDEGPNNNSEVTELNETREMLNDWDLENNIVLEGKKDDTRFEDVVGADIENLYYRVSDGKLHILLERVNPEGAPVNNTDYEYDVPFDIKNQTYQMLVSLSEGMNLFSLPPEEERTEKGYEVTQLGDSGRDEDIKVEYYPKYVDIEVALDRFAIEDINEEDFIFHSPHVKKIEENLADEQEFRSLR